MRLVLDTCVVVAAVRSRTGASHVLVDLATRGEITAVLTVPLVYEYEDVLHRPENRVEGWSEDDLSALVDSLLGPSDCIRPNFSYRPLLKDEADEMVLEAAINGEADIVTFNVKHFGPAVHFGVQIFKPGEALRILQEGGLAYGTK
jgi:putative PIN family toxin of toxin-antitoxin system